MNNNYTQAQWIKQFNRYGILIIQDIYMDELTRVEIDMDLPDLLDVPSSAGYSYFFGERESFYLSANLATIRTLDFRYGINYAFGNLADYAAGRYTFIVDNGTLTFGENSLRVMGWGGSFSNQGLGVFCNCHKESSTNWSPAVNTAVFFKIYGIKIYKYTDSTRETKNLVADLVPAMRNSDMISGLYDEVSDKFYCLTDFPSTYLYRKKGIIISDLTQISTITINPTPADADVVIFAENYTQEGNTITVLDGTPISYTVSKEGYLTVQGTLTADGDRTINVQLEPISGTYTLTVIASPLNSSISFQTGEIDYTIDGNSITLYNVADVTYSVFCYGYQSITETITLDSNKTIYVNLIKEADKKVDGKTADFDYKYDYSPVLLWQYTNSPNMTKLVEKEQLFLDVAITQFKEEFDRNIFNLKTCGADGLDLWGRVLGVQRPIINAVIATDEQYRLLLLVRFSLLTWDGSCEGLTKTIRDLFPKAIFNVVDCPLDDNDEIIPMSAKINFAGGITDEQKDILSIGYTDPTSGEFVYTFLPRPAGVMYDLGFNADWSRILGFDGMTETTNMGGAYDCDPDDYTGETGTENPDGGVFYK